MAEFNLTSSNSGYLNAKVVYSISGTSVTATLYVKKGSSTTEASTGHWRFKLTVGGKGYSSLTTASSSQTIYHDWVSIASYTGTISGTGSIYAYATGPSGTSIASYSAEGSKSISTATAPTINSFSVDSKTVNSVKCKFTCTTADSFFYKLSTATSWTNGTTGTITSGSFIVSGLKPNTSYTIDILVRKWIDSSTYLEDYDSLTVTTYQIGQISSVGNFNHGSSASVVVTNPSGTALSLAMKIGSTTILTKTVSAGTNTISFTDAQLDSIYKLYGSGNTLTATFILTTASSYTNSKTCTITLTGNQKTAYVGASGKKRAKVYVGVNGTVKRAVVWIGNNGRKRCI